MKIWILTSETPFNQPGGIARYVHNFATFLGAAGHSVTVISRDQESRRESIAEGYRLVTFATREKAVGTAPEGVPVDEHPSYPYNLLAYWMALSWDYAAQVRRMVEEEGPPDVIESQEYMGIAYFLLHAKHLDPNFLAGVPIVLNLHSPDFILKRINQEPRFELPVYWAGQMEKYCILAADRVICPSRYLAAQVQQLLQAHDLTIEVLPLPWTDVAYLPEQKEEPTTILYYGRIEYRKGVLPLLRQCETLWQNGQTFRLRMIGSDTPYAGKNMSMMEFIRTLYGERIQRGQLEMPGAIEHRLLLLEIARAGVVVIPSLWENFPNTCMEAMSLGKVVVASTEGGQAEMIGTDGSCGLLFDWKKPGDLAEKLLRALHMSPAERSAMGLAAKAQIRRLCSPEVVLPLRLAHFREAVENAGPRTRYPFVNLRQRCGPLPELPADPVEQKNLVTVIVPFYNLGETILETLESILAQTYRPLEILIFNDGSNDPMSLQVLSQVRNRKLPEVRIVDVPNAGLAQARNTAARMARGEFLVFCDADDCLEPAFVEKTLRVAQLYPNVHIVYTWVRYFGEIQGIFSTWNAEFPFFLAHNMFIPICLVRRSAFLAYGQNRSEMVFGLEDYDGWIAMLEAGCGALSIPEVLARYRVRKDSMFREIKYNQMQYLYDTIVSGHPHLYQEYGDELFLLQNANGPGYLWTQPAPWVSPLAELLAKAHTQPSEKMSILERDLAWNMKEVKFLNETIEKLRVEIALEKARANAMEGRVTQTQIANEKLIKDLTAKLEMAYREVDDIQTLAERKASETKILREDLARANRILDSRVELLKRLFHF